MEKWKTLAHGNEELTGGLGPSEAKCLPEGVVWPLSFFQHWFDLCGFILRQGLLCGGKMSTSSSQLAARWLSSP